MRVPDVYKRQVGQVVLEGHLNHCVRDGIEHGDADRTIAEFAKAIEHFLSLIHILPLQHHLSHLVQCALGGVDLHQHVLTGHVLIHHLVDGAQLPDDLFQSAVEVVRIHTLSQWLHPLSLL